MENIKPITVPKGITNLKDYKDFKMPVNCIFNKGITGCGGTEHVLNQKGNAIIAVPTINLVKNKETHRKWRKHDVLGV